MAGFFVGKEVKVKNYDWKYTFEKRKAKAYNREQKAGGFTCSHCKQFIVIDDSMGTAHRNHCNYCLWSKHVDLQKPGDRKATCHGGMQPVGLTFKDEGNDKYGNPRQGELKIVHRCAADLAISTNRIAADDDVDALFNILYAAMSLDHEVVAQLQHADVMLLEANDRKMIEVQLFGK
ncbi:MAG: RNHCP domain-containing protein [Candidatus Levybacteria bacterium]|nr:RNHCP domain-containing protein [Candidatus Levybacteria bacterium]